MTHPKTLNVCLYSPASEGGHALYSRELLTAIAEVGARRGVTTELVTCTDMAPAHRTPAYPIRDFLPPLVHRGAFRTPLHWAGSRLAYYPRRERTFVDWVAARGGEIDIIHFQDYTPWLAPRHWAALRRRGFALVYTVHNVRFHYHRNRLQKLVRDGCLRAAWRSCNALLVHTEGLRGALADFLGPGHPPIFVTPHGIWTDHGADRRRHEPVGPRHRLLFFGAIRPNKGVDVLLRAMPRLDDCSLTIAGEAEEAGYHARVRELAARLPAGRIELVDRYVDEGEVAGYFDRSELVILPYTFFAAQSGVLHMALAYGRPLVVTDVGGLGECVRRWGVGVVVPPNDPGALADGIARALEPSAYRAAVEAIDRVRGELSWTRMAEATIDVYRSILA